MDRALQGRFERTYDATIIGSIPPGCRQYSFVLAGLTTGIDETCVVIESRRQGRWVGRFAGATARHGATGVYATPTCDVICVVSRGAGYLVDVNSPLRYDAISIRPILQVRVLEEAGVLVFASYTKVAGLTRSGPWLSGQVSYDGIELGSLDRGALTGRGWSAPRDEWIPFRMNPLDGTHTGGGFP